jgi:hypothetical protein
MLNRTQLVAICKRLERSMQEAGFVFFDVQFDEAAQTLRIILNRLNKRPPRRSASLAHADATSEYTIDARVLWDVLRDLNKLGVANPAIQLREEGRGHCQAREFVGREDLRPFSRREGSTSR